MRINILHFYFSVNALLWSSPSLANASLETAVYHYSDHDRTSTTQQIQAQYLWQRLEGESQTQPTLLNIGLQSRQLQFRDKDSFVVREQMQGKTRDGQASINVFLEQGFTTTVAGGIGGGYSSSQLGDSYYYQISVSDWFRDETLQLGAAIGKSKSDQVSAIVYDTISRRVRLPENISGTSYSLNFLHLTTPKLMLNGDYTFSQRSDRPDAHAFNVLGRYFFPAPHAALHLGGSYFANAPGLKESSLYGLVEAFAVEVSWQQRFGDNWVLVPGYRYYREWTAARHDDDTSILLVTDSPSLVVRYRWGHARWIETANEAYFMAQRYHSNEPREGMLLGAGHIWHF